MDLCNPTFFTGRGPGPSCGGFFLINPGLKKRPFSTAVDRCLGCFSPGIPGGCQTSPSYGGIVEELCRNKIWWKSRGFPRPENQTQMTTVACARFFLSQIYSYLVMVKFHSLAESNEITSNNKSKHTSHPKPEIYLKLLDLPTVCIFVVEKYSIHSCWSGSKFANLKKQVQVTLDNFYPPNTWFFVQNFELTWSSLNISHKPFRNATWRFHPQLVKGLGFP